MRGCEDIMNSNSVLKENNYLTTGVQTESVEKLLIHIALQTKNIDDKLKMIIDKHVAQDFQSHYNEINKTLSVLKEKALKT